MWVSVFLFRSKEGEIRHLHYSVVLFASYLERISLVYMLGFCTLNLPIFSAIAVAEHCKMMHMVQMHCIFESRLLQSADRGRRGPFSVDGAANYWDCAGDLHA